MAHFLIMISPKIIQHRQGVRTSIENKTPPIGDPNATATPAALAAVTISRILTEKLWSLPCGGGVIYGLTLTTRKFLE